MKQGFFVLCFILATGHLMADELKSFENVPFGSPKEKLGCNSWTYNPCKNGNSLFYLDEKDAFFMGQSYSNYSQESHHIQNDYLSPVSEHALKIDELIQKYGKPSQSNEDGGIGQIVKGTSKNFDSSIKYKNWTKMCIIN